MTPTVRKHNPGPVERRTYPSSAPLSISTKPQQSHRFFVVYCQCESKRKGKAPTSNWLGAVSVDSPTTVHYHCKNCKSNYAVTVSEDHIPVIIKITDYLEYPDQVAGIVGRAK